VIRLSDLKNQKTPPTKTALLQGLGDKPDAKHRLLSFVQKLHSPFGILFHVAGDTANKIAADPGHLDPGSVAVGQINAAVGNAGESAVANLEIIQWHCEAVSFLAVVGRKALATLLANSFKTVNYGPV
jgi:hypothetical protein